MFRHAHRVRDHEVDTQGFLFNSRYLELADVTLTEFFRDLGWPCPKLVAGGTDPSVAGFQLDMVVTRDETKIADIELVYVNDNVDAEAARSRPLPEDVAQVLRDTIAAEPSHH